jgi:hypothetical protein
MMGKYTDSAHTELAYGVSSDSNLSEEERKPWTCECKKSQRSKLQRGREKQKKDKDNEPKKNTCPHCKKFHCKKPHQVKPDKCMWNKKYKGYNNKLICKELGVAFKPRCVTFLADTESCKSTLSLCFTMPATFIFTKFVQVKRG